VLGEVERLDVDGEDARPEGGRFAVLAAVEGKLARERREGARSRVVRRGGEGRRGVVNAFPRPVDGKARECTEVG
jgi:hypothetical protein